MATPLVFEALDGGFPSDDLRKILHGGQRMAKLPNSVQTLPNFNPLRTAHERYRRQTDRRQTDMRQNIPERNVFFQNEGITVFTGVFLKQ